MLVSMYTLLDSYDANDGNAIHVFAAPTSVGYKIRKKCLGLNFILLCFVVVDSSSKNSRLVVYNSAGSA